VTARRSYLPFGGTWGSSTPDLPTAFAFTGQREDLETGLYYYIARYYDPDIAHFTQADTVVPGAGNPIAYDRYAYVFYNPLNYVDPSGHWVCNDLSDPACAETASELATVYQYIGLLDADFDTSILPDWIPTRDQDLFLAYVYLFTQTDEIYYGPYSSFSISGQELGMVIAENHIQILWDTEGICSGAACVMGGEAKIFINANRRNGPDGGLLNLVRSISHEAFHKTDPFKQGDVSQYEELFALHIGGIMSNTEKYILSGDLDRFLNASAINVQMNDWFDYNPYAHLPPYPRTTQYNLIIQYYQYYRDNPEKKDRYPE